MPLPVRNARLKLSFGQLFWREVGWGKTLVFLHGSWEDGQQWSEVIEQLGDRYHCLVPDLLGFGESEQFRGARSIARQVDALAEYFAHLKLREVYLIGHSIGGWVATRYALRYPQQVKGLVLLAPEGMDGELAHRRWRRERWLTSRLPLVAWGLKLAQAFGIKSAKRSLKLRRTLLQSSMACKLLFNRRQSEIAAESLREGVCGLQPPLLIVQGEQDDSIEVAKNRAFAKAPYAKLTEISGSTHAIESVAEIAQTIAEFVALTS